MLQQLKVIVQILPYLIDLIKLIEDNLPEKGKGKEKLQFVREVLEQVYPEFNDNWSVIEKVIGSLVSLFNSTGLFRKSSAPLTT